MNHSKKIPTVWQQEMAKGSEFGKKIQRSLSKTPHTNTVVSKQPNYSKLGISLQQAIETEIGYTITCGECLAFFRSIKDDTDHLDILNGLIMKAPSPDFWRKKYNTKEKKRIRYQEILNNTLSQIKTSSCNTVGEIKDHDWVVAVTTAPRQEPTLAVCLESITKAGWEPVVFAEPDSIEVPKYRYFKNTTKQGAWFNWLSSMKWCLERTSAKYILSVQDDSLFHPDSKSFVESIIWPSNKVGFVSLYTPAHYSSNLSGELRKVGVNKISTSWLWGACALLFPRESLKLIIDHPLTSVWTGVPPKGLTDKEKLDLIEKKKENPHLIQNVDTALGKIINGLHLEMWFIDPSPVKHISLYSAIGHASNTGKRNCSRCADHSKPLDEQVFPHE